MGGGAAAEGEEEVPSAGPPPHSAGESELRQVAAHVDTLISSSYSIKSFPGKWQSIRNKLAKLSSGLAAAAAGGAASPGSGDVPALSELLQGINSTVDKAVALAGACADQSYAGGKLLMRSNLDLVASRLELHARSLEQVYASGVLTHARAIVLSKPGAGASRDDMRLYVKDLLSRVKVGGPGMAASALLALNEVLREDDKYVRVAAAETPELVGLLVGLLEAGDRVVQEEATEAVSVLAGFDSYRPSLVLAGAVAALIRVLENGTGSGKRRAAGALRKLTENADNAWSVSAHGGVTALLKLCGDPGSGGELVGSAGGVLRNLAGVGEIRRFMVEQGAVPVFVKLSGAKEEATAIQAMEFLQAIAGDDPNVKARVAREGGMESLLRALDPNTPSSSKAREVALRAVEALCFSPASSVSALIGAGFLGRVLFFLRHGETSVQESALKAASRLCAVSEATRRAMGDAGFVPELVGMLEAKSPEVRATAAEALSRMVSVQRNQKRLLQEEHGVDRLLQLLCQEDEEKTAMAAARKHLLSTLAAIADSSSGRRRIAASGYVSNLEKLAEADVAEAKKIIKKLSSNRFLNMLSAIWNS
uniref:Vacuolar protein 8 n=1 Tax=Anthurium amnicola TaxID=1678845 RepID=A0A1D1YYP6_9ARAE